MRKMGIVIAVDGPAGSGKGTVTKRVAEELNLVNIDTGAMYRCVALECMKKNIDATEISKIEEILENIDIRLKRIEEKQVVLLNGEDVTSQIRTREVDNCVSKYAMIKQVRDKITPMQHSMGEKQNIIMEGRDIGTVVFPNAAVKIFLDCSVEERAKRRYKQNIERGIESNYEEILAEIERRNKLDSEREIAPLVKAEDAVLVDSTNMSIEEVVQEIIKIIKEKVEI